MFEKGPAEHDRRGTISIHKKGVEYASRASVPAEFLLFS